MHSYSCNSVHFGETGQFFPGKLITTFYEVKRWNNKQKSAEIRINTFHEVERPRGTHSEDLAVSLLVNDSIKQEIKCYSRQFFQFPLKKSPFFGLPIDKVENFSKKKKISKTEYGFMSTWSNLLWLLKNVYHQVL